MEKTGRINGEPKHGFIGNDAAVAFFAACGGKGKDICNGDSFFSGSGFTGNQIPYITFIINTERHGFTGINNASASYSQKEINIFFPADFNPFSYQGYSGIRDYAR